MRITKYGHACLLVEEGNARILLDPGMFSHGFEELTDLDAILITHQHGDHVQAETLGTLLGANPDAKLYADADTAQLLSEASLEAQTVHQGDRFKVAGVPVAVIGRD